MNETVLAKTIYSYVNLGKELQPFVKNGDRRMSKVVIHDMLMTTAVIAAGGEPAVYGITFQATSIDATPTRKY